MTLTDLLSIPENLEDNFLTYFRNVGLELIGVGSDEAITENTISVQVTQGNATGHVQPAHVTGTGEPEEDWFNCVFAVSVTTDSSGDHSLRVSTLKKQMLRGMINAGFNSELYYINGINFGGQIDTVTETGSRQSILTWNLLVCIIPEMWGNTQ